VNTDISEHLRDMIGFEDLLAVGLFGVVGNAMRQGVDFERELAFYGSYHQDPVNQAIHFVFIPMIWWSICIFMCYRPIFGVPASVAGHQITWGTGMLAIYALYYTCLDPYTGGLASAVYALLYVHASSAVSSEKAFKELAAGKEKGSAGRMPWWKIAFVLHAVAWFMQIVPGHKMAEGVKPALMDSLGQAFGVAPMFAVLEGIWAVGLAQPLKAAVTVLVKENREEMCRTAVGGATFPWCTR
jgi:uncharacterized membrane protein YGL010W